jgi:hypothetical protein
MLRSSGLGAWAAAGSGDRIARCRRKRKAHAFGRADRADLEKARPFLGPIGSTIRHFGAVGVVVSRRNGAPS